MHFFVDTQSFVQSFIFPSSSPTPIISFLQRGPKHSLSIKIWPVPFTPFSCLYTHCLDLTAKSINHYQPPPGTDREGLSIGRIPKKKKKSTLKKKKCKNKCFRVILHLHSFLPPPLRSRINSDFQLTKISQWHKNILQQYFLSSTVPMLKECMVV